MKAKSLGILMLLVIIAVAFYLLLPNMKGMKVSTEKRNLVNSAKIYGDEIKTLWNSDAIYCDAGNGLYKSTIAIPHAEYYVVVGKNDVNPNLPVIKLNKVKEQYYGYVKINYSGISPEFSVFLTDGKYSITSGSGYSNIASKDVKKEKLSFTFDSSYHYCKSDH